MSLKVSNISDKTHSLYIQLPQTKQITHFELKIYEVDNAVQLINISARISAVDSVYWAEQTFLVHRIFGIY